MTTPSHVYFISDVHLGVDYEWSSEEREKQLILWLEEVSSNAKKIYIVGDLFDYWFEYRSAVPKGYFNLLSTLRKLSDRNIEINYLTGNHDMWHKDYVADSTGVRVTHGYVIDQIDGLKFYITHGDGLGSGDRSYKVIRSILKNRACHKLFSLLHPSIGLPLMKYMSRKSRESHESKLNPTLRQKEYCRSIGKKRNDIDYFIMGHAHSPEVTDIEYSQYVNLGDWTNHFTFAIWDGQSIELKRWNPIRS